MTIDEIIDWKVELDAKIQVDQARLRAAEDVLAAKLKADAVRQALANAGIIVPEGGSVTISPPPAIVGVEPGEVS